MIAAKPTTSPEAPPAQRLSTPPFRGDKEHKDRARQAHRSSEPKWGPNVDYSELELKARLKSGRVGPKYVIDALFQYV